jgi:SAM-dependent methyltransferase
MFLPIWVGSAPFYDELSQTEGYYLPNKWEFDAALRDLTNSRKILEIGSGDGLFLEKLNSLGKETLGIDKSPKAILRARERGLCVLDCDLHELSAKSPNAFDAVCAFQVLEHVADPVEMLTAGARCLKPGGIFILAVPNADGILKYMRPSRTDIPPHHLTRWTSRCFSYLNGLGLRVKRLECEPLDAARFHWLLRWWDELCGTKPIADASALSDFGRNPIWFAGRLTLHYGLYFLRRVGIPQLPFIEGHSIYVVLEKF